MVVLDVLNDGGNLLDIADNTLKIWIPPFFLATLFTGRAAWLDKAREFGGEVRQP